MHQQVAYFNKCTLCPHCIYVLCICLRADSDLCHLHHTLIGFYNRDEKCLQRGTNWVFKWSSLRSVFKRLNSAVDGDGWSTPRLGRFTPGKVTRDPLYRRLGGLQNRSVLVRKISQSPGFDTRNVQLVAYHDTDWATQAPNWGVQQLFLIPR
jgi:hypothetical protein